MDVVAEDEDVLARTLGRHADGLALLFSRLSQDEQLRTALVCKAWKDGSDHTLGQLHSLDLRSLHDSLDDARLACLLEKCANLRSLNLSGCRHVSDDGLAALPRCCPKLMDVNLTCMPLITANGVETGVVDGLARSLESLELAGCSKITPTELVTRFSRFLELDDDEDGLNSCQG